MKIVEIKISVSSITWLDQEKARNSGIYIYYIFYYTTIMYLV